MQTWNLEGLSKHDIEMMIEDEQISIRALERRLDEMRVKRVAHSKQTAQYMLIEQRKSGLRDLLDQVDKQDEPTSR